MWLTSSALHDSAKNALQVENVDLRILRMTPLQNGRFACPLIGPAVWRLLDYHIELSTWLSGFCSARSFQPKQRSSEPNQSRVWSVLEIVGTGLVLMRICTASPLCSSCLQCPASFGIQEIRRSAISPSISHFCCRLKPGMAGRY